MIALSLARLREPSTQAGFAVLLGMVGIKIAPEAWAAGIEVASVLAAFAAVVMPERGK
jgi:hypothetical protein